jgi:hypothetical protein
MIKKNEEKSEKDSNKSDTNRSILVFLFYFPYFFTSDWPHFLNLLNYFISPYPIQYQNNKYNKEECENEIKVGWEINWIKMEKNMQAERNMRSDD